MKAKANWQLSIELNVSFDDSLSPVTRDFVRRLITDHPTVLVAEFTDDGAMLSVGPSQLESLLCRLQMVSTPLCRLSFAVHTVLVESSDYDDAEGIFDVGGDDSNDSFFALSEERPIVKRTAA